MTGGASLDMRFHHIGYAVDNIDRFVDEFFRPVFRPLSITERVFDPIQKVMVCFARMHGDTVIELVEPQNSDSPLRSIIGSNRGGVYHLGYEVDDLDKEIERCRKTRCMPLGRPVPAVAFDGRRIVFLLTPQRDLIELVEVASLRPRGGI
jgi:methylmalonyl-CoA/ethylmalonyl-CoA epimerase